MKNVKQEKPKTVTPISEETDYKVSKYFFVIICSIEIIFILWKFVFAGTRNGQTFLTTLIIVSVLSLPPGFGLLLNIFKSRDISFLFTFGLCIGFGLVAGIWSLIIQIGCPLNVYIYIGIILGISLYLFYRKLDHLKSIFIEKENKNILVGLLSPIAVLLFAFIVLSLSLINNFVPGDVDCQSDSYTTLMILKEGTYPYVSPFLNEIRLRLGSGPVFHVFTAIIVKLKSGVLLDEIMAMSVISGSFFCMSIYFVARFVIKNQIILFLAGILTLTRAYFSFFNDGNLPENIAFYFGAIFIVFLLHTMENRKVIFASLSGLFLAFCMFSHPIVFMYNFGMFSAFFVTLLISREKKTKQDYLNLLIAMGVILVLVLPYMYRIRDAQPVNLQTKEATTLISSVTYWTGFPVVILAFAGAIILTLKKKTANIYLWSSLFMVIVFVEYWRIYQIWSPSWFEMKAMASPQFGTYYSYTDFLKYPMGYHTAWFSGVIIWPVGISAFINFLYILSRRYINIQIMPKDTIMIFVVLVFFLIGYESKKTKKYPEFTLKSDYAALEWIKENTSYNDTLIFTPSDNSKPQKYPEYLTSYWVPVIAERKSVYFRNHWIPGQFKFIDMDIPLTEKVNKLQEAAYDISKSESYKLIKDMNISHIFVSACVSGTLYNIYNESSFLELVHYNTLPEQGTALVYKVK